MPNNPASRWLSRAYNALMSAGGSLRSVTVLIAAGSGSAC